jgi:hypothetical protein
MVGSLFGAWRLGSGQSGSTAESATTAGSAMPRGSPPPPPNQTQGGTLRTSGLPTLLPVAILNRVPTRVRVPALDIDLPIVQPPPDPDHYPYCNVAEFIPTMSRPGRPGATFLYAHARSGMFLPILEAAGVRNGRAMIGMEVEIFTSDNRLFTYHVSEVRRHVVSLEFAYRATAEQAILQTSEGPHGTPGKTVLIAVPGDERPASVSEAQPVPRPVACGFS